MIKAYTPTATSNSCEESGRDKSRWYHAEVTVTADSMRMSVNHQPPTEQAVSVDVVAMLERLTIGGGTASDVADSFHGCVKNIKVNNRFLLANDMTLQGNVLPNSCPN